MISPFFHRLFVSESSTERNQLTSELKAMNADVFDYFLLITSAERFDVLPNRKFIDKNTKDLDFLFAFLINFNFEI